MNFKGEDRCAMASAMGLSHVRRGGEAVTRRSPTAGEASDRKEGTPVLHGGKISIPKEWTVALRS